MAKESGMGLRRLRARRDDEITHHLIMRQPVLRIGTKDGEFLAVFNI